MDTEWINARAQTGAGAALNAGKGATKKLIARTQLTAPSAKWRATVTTATDAVHQAPPSTRRKLMVTMSNIHISFHKWMEVPTNDPQSRTYRWTNDQTEKTKEAITTFILANPPKSEEELTRALQEVCEESLKKRYPRTRRTGKRWWSSEIETLRRGVIKARRNLTRSNQKTQGHPNPEHVLEYKAAYERFKEGKDAAKASLHHQLCEELNQNPWGDAYRTAIKRLTPKSRAVIPLQPEKILSSLFPSHPPVIFQATSSEGHTDISPQEVIAAAKKLKTGKSPGLDGTPAEVVKLAALLAPAIFADIFTDLMHKGSFPEKWKTAALKLIPKEGHTDLTPKLRPICLINSVAKLFEHIVNERLLGEITRTSGISKNQHAFTRKRSCASALDAVLKFMERTHRRGQGWVPAVILLDIQNAFNSARWQTILEKLRNLGVKEYLVKMLHSYLSNRTLNLGGKSYVLTSGVPQGSVLGPTLWNILIDPVACIKCPDFCEVVLYADDVAVLVGARDRATMVLRGNLALRRVQEAIDGLGLQLCPQKSTAMIVSQQRTSIPGDTVFKLNDLTIAPVTQVKYLGVTIDNNLNFNAHAKRVCAAATCALNALGAILSAENVRMARRRVIATVIESKLLYGSEIWLHRISKSGLEQMEAVQKRAAVRVTRGLPRMSGDAALVLAGMTPLAIQARARQDRFLNGRRTPLAEMQLHWQRAWKETGPNWTKSLVPDIRDWVNRKHGELGSGLTEVLSGHGHFGTYLKMTKKRKDSMCPYCNTPETLRHLIMNCPRFDRERTSAGLQMEVNPRKIVQRLLGSREEWRRVEILANRIREEGMKSP